MAINERSAEWLRGRKEAIFEIYDAWKCMDSAPFRHYIHEIADDALASDDIAAAEAREAPAPEVIPGDSLSKTVAKLREACSGVRVEPEPEEPSAAEVIAAAEKALERLLPWALQAGANAEDALALCARWKEANGDGANTR